jgi:hypothetical protein
MRPLYIVTEEVWSISHKTNERRLLSRSERPVYSGGTKRLAYGYARELASKFQYHDVHDDDDQLYWWGRNERDHVNRRFVIEPAPPSLLTLMDGRGSRGGGLSPAPPSQAVPAAVRC